MANPVRQFFDSKPEAARVVLVDTSGDIYNASGGGAGSDVNIDSIGGNPVTTTIPVSGTVSVTEPVSVDDNGGSLTVDGPLTDAELRATPVPVSGTVSVNEPVTVDATDLDIRNLVAATDSVTIHGDVGVVDQLDLSNTNPLAVAIVDGSGDQITSFGGGTQYNQGTATTDTDVLTMAGAVRRDTAAVASGVADGDRLVLSTDAAGRLRVNGSDTTQPISATDLDIRNLVFATDKVDVSGSTSVGVTGPLTDTQLRATPVPVSGTVTVGSITAGDNIIGRVKITDGTDLALVTAAGEQNVIATAQPGVDIGDVTINNAAGASAVNIQDGGNSITVDGTVATTAPANTVATGTLTAAAQTVSITLPVGASSVGLQITGVWTGVINIEHTTDNSNWTLASGYNAAAGDAFVSITSNGIFEIPCGTLSSVRVIADSWTSGTANIRFISNTAVGVVNLAGSLSSGGNQIGSVLLTDGTDFISILAAGADNVSNSEDQIVTASMTYAFDGASWDRVTNGGGTEATALRVTVANDSTGKLEVVGDVAADAPAAGNPVLVAASSETMADSAPANRVSQDADATRLSATDGALFVITTGPQTFQFIATGAQTGAQVHASPGTGLSLYITDITFSINSATASSIKVLNNGGADIWGPHYLEAIAGRGLAVHFTTPLKVTAATRLDVTTTGAATQTTNIQGFIAPG